MFQMSLDFVVVPASMEALRYLDVSTHKMSVELMEIGVWEM